MPRFRTTSGSLIYLEDFEGLKCFPVDQVNKPTLNTTHAIENNGSAEALSFPYYAGSKCARFRLIKTEPLFQGTTYRTEVTVVKAEEDARVTPEGWYSFKVLFPTDGAAPDERKTSINQWFEDGSDELTLRTMNGFCFLELQSVSGTVYRWDLFSDKSNTDGSTTGFVAHDLDKWNQFVFHINHKMDATGFIEVYRNGIKKHDFKGQTIHKEVPKWKLGIYSSQSRSTVPYKIIFFDDIRVGNNTATLGDMVGGTGGGIIPPTPPITDELNVMVDNDQLLDLPVNATTFISRISGMKAGDYTVKVSATGNGITTTDEIKITVRPEEVVPPEPPEEGELITGFKLINCETEKSVADITEGGTYDLSTLGLNKVSVEALADATVTQVGFVCTGPTPKTSTDKGKPFSLHGDVLRSDGTVNYQYGNWGPPAAGVYKIVVTPYVGTAAQPTVTINFTITA